RRQQINAFLMCSSGYWTADLSEQFLLPGSPTALSRRYPDASASTMRSFRMRRIMESPLDCVLSCQAIGDLSLSRMAYSGQRTRTKYLCYRPEHQKLSSSGFRSTTPMQRRL